MTEFKKVYDVFLAKITEDMYMELTMDDTLDLLQELLLASIHHFEFPRKNLYDYNLEVRVFNSDLSIEEINILATYMVVEWIGQQLASIENIRMKYTGADFKMTSQANHLAKLSSLKKDYTQVGFHLQRLYKRRRTDSQGRVLSTMDQIMAPSKVRRRRNEV